VRTNLRNGFIMDLPYEVITNACMQFIGATIKAATIIVTILPIICVYPLIQKHFVKGIMLGGGVKE
jgi:ABC-type glycerol-3-phosphate transport system permease component